jgi:hypothetical protein
LRQKNGKECGAGVGRPAVWRTGQRQKKKSDKMEEKEKKMHKFSI